MQHQPSTPASHGIAEVEPGVRIHYVVAGTGHRTVVLLHGYPQTWWEFRHIIGPLVQAGWRVVAPDYRGAGGSSKPNTGYDKRTMAKDVVVRPIPECGHWIAEENPAALLAELRQFFGQA